jgi:hypothetical protein
MASVSFEELFPEVLATAPNCPMPTVVRNIRNAARELCERARCWRVTVENEPVLPGNAQFDFFVPPDTVLVSPVSLTLNGCPLRPASLAELNEEWHEWETQIGAPVRYLRSTEDVNSIRLVPIPEREYTTGVHGEIAVKPSRTATAIDEIILDRYGTALVQGALAHLLSISGTTWFSPQLAMAHKVMFDQAVDAARSYANGDDMPKVRKVRYGGI